MFPDNFVQAAFQQVETEYVQSKLNQTNVGTITVWHSVRKHVDGMDALGMIVLFIALGLMTGQVGREAKVLRHFVLKLKSLPFM